MNIGDFAHHLSRRVEGLTGAVTDPFRPTVIRLGVTGLARAGKTVFITSLVANLTDRGRMSQLRAVGAARGPCAFDPASRMQSGMAQPPSCFETCVAGLKSTR